MPSERAARLIGMLFGTEVSAGFVDKAGSRLSALLGKAGAPHVLIVRTLDGRLTWLRAIGSRRKSVTLDIAVNRSTQGGAAVIWTEPSAATPLTVQVAWESFSPGSGHEGQNAQPPPTADPSPSAPLTPWIP